jgi:hypothetical protein
MENQTCQESSFVDRAEAITGSAADTLFGFAYGGASTLFPAIVGGFFGRLAVGAIPGFARVPSQTLLRRGQARSVARWPCAPKWPRPRSTGAMIAQLPGWLSAASPTRAPIAF